MNWQTFLDPNLSQRLCLTLLHSLWQVALLALIARLAARFWRRRSVEREYVFHTAALIASLIAMPVTFVFTSTPAPATAERITVVEPTIMTVAENPVDNPQETIAPAPFDSSIAEQTPHPTPSGIAAPPVRENYDWAQVAPWAAALYAAGVALMLSRLAVGLWRAGRLSQRGTILRDGPLVELVRTLAAKWSMTAIPALIRVEEIFIPKVVGLLRPSILLPASALAGLSATELEMILIHELAHLRRFDMWVNLLQRLAEAILFFNPAAWYLSRRISALREYCCDEMACQTVALGNSQVRTEYAMALMRVVELARIAMQPPASNAACEHDNIAALAASGRSPSQLRKRIASLFGEPLSEPLRLSARGVLGVVAVLAIMLLGVTSWSRGDGARDAEAARTRFEKAAAQRKELSERSRTAGKSNSTATPFRSTEFARNLGILLRGVSLSNTMPGFFSEYDFKGADLTESTLSGGRDAFHSAIFARADFSRAKLTGSDAAFQAANFEKTALGEAVLAGGTASFQGANFKEADLKKATLSGGVGAFQGATFEGSDLTNAVLSAEGGGFQLASFDSADLTGAKITCFSLTAFQSASISATIFCDADLSTIDSGALASCVFPLESPPKYNATTLFPKDFDPARQGWVLANKAAGASDVSKYVFMFTAETQTGTGNSVVPVEEKNRTGFPAIVMAQDGEGTRSILISTPWEPSRFDVGDFGQKTPRGPVYLYDPHARVKVFTPARVLTYDDRFGFGLFVIEKHLDPIPSTFLSEELKPGDELTELTLTPGDSPQPLRVLAVNQSCKYASVLMGEPVEVDRAISFEGKLDHNPGTFLLKDGKVAAVLITAAEDTKKGKSYALPIKFVHNVFSNARGEDPAARSEAEPENEDRGVSQFFEKGHVSTPGANSSTLVPLNVESDEKRGLNLRVRKADAPWKASASPPVGRSQQQTFPITISGRAIDAGGKAIAGATIYLASPRTNPLPVATVKTDDSGAYQFEDVPLPIQRGTVNGEKDFGHFEVFGEAPGYALVWRPAKWFVPSSAHEAEPNWAKPEGRDFPTKFGRGDPIQLDLTFAKPAKLSGRIVDDRGEPLANSEVAIQNSDPDWNRDKIDTIRPRMLESLRKPALIPPRIKTRQTDADGRFEFDQLPPDHRFWIDVKPPEHPTWKIHAVTHAGVTTDRQGHRVYSGDFELKFARPQPVVVYVRYDDTGAPAENILVSVRNDEFSSEKTTDYAGRAGLTVPSGENRIEIWPAFGTPYLHTEIKTTISATPVGQVIEAKIDRAAIVDITVRDAETGDPLSGVDVWRGLEGEEAYVHSYDKEVHTWRSWEAATGTWHVERPRTDEHGTTRALFKPGKRRIGVGLAAFPRGYVPFERDGKEIQCEVGKPVEVAFALRKRTSDPDKEPKQASTAPRVHEKNYVVVPWANTGLQRERGTPLNAYVLIDGNSLYTKDKQFDSQALDWEQLAKDLQPFSDLSKGAVNFHVFNFNLDVANSHLVGWALEGFGKQRAGFQKSYVSATYSGSGRFQDMIDATSRKMAGRKEGSESVLGTGLARAYPVQTFASSILNENADYVVYLGQPIIGDSGRAFPANVREAILRVVANVEVAQKKKLLIKYQFRLPAAEKTVEWIQASGAQELAKELGYEEGAALGSPVSD